MTEKLPLVFSHDFKKRIWQVCQSGGTSLILEVRDEELGRISLYSYNSEEGIRMIPIRNIPWWGMLLSAGENHLVTRSFGEEGQTDRLILTGYDPVNGEIRWEKDNLKLLEVGESKARIYQNEEMWIDMASGKEVPFVESGPEQNKNIFHPFQYTAGSDYFQTVVKFITDKTGEQAVRAIDYFEYHQSIIIAYYVMEDQVLINRILVANEKGDILYTDTLAKELQGISDYSFFIFDGNLIFVKGLSHFFIYSLPT